MIQWLYFETKVWGEAAAQRAAFKESIITEHKVEGYEEAMIVSCYFFSFFLPIG